MTKSESLVALNYPLNKVLDRKYDTVNIYFPRQNIALTGSPPAPADGGGIAESTYCTNIARTTTVICEKHFTPEDYEVSVHGNKVLKKVPVPSVFDFPVHLKKERSHRRVLKRKHEESNSKATEQTLAICEVVEEPENGDHAEDGNILAAGPSNVTQNLGFLESSEPSNICNLRVKRSPVYFGDFKISDLNNLQRRNRFWKTAHETVHEYEKK
ncbi:unnamed protein product [Acanthoscelides obtectus]|uniref:THAP-type domain-containing protein n=1 Tax=Acanthoscelides obtectus TaxID=200917 RepID=A0A9P0KQ96_ACAOB|nr:unnamed protein product [Acanthoscelides obtectus]CAK1641203.1 hypothetical protein AOBTE_LOCUS12235 [Acanthoscelides obtectus]